MLTFLLDETTPLEQGLKLRIKVYKTKYTLLDETTPLEQGLKLWYEKEKKKIDTSLTKPLH